MKKYVVILLFSILLVIGFIIYQHIQSGNDWIGWFVGFLGFSLLLINQS